MLTELCIRHLAVVEEARICFRRGFIALTGETGAGKSIVVDALSLVAGARGSADFVRHGSEKAEIEALFDLEEDHPARDVCRRYGLDGDPGEPLVVRRELTATGKSVCRVNGRLVNLSTLRELGECLINIHGQHEFQSLVRPETHLAWLDAFGGKPVGDALGRYAELYARFQALRKERRELEEAMRRALQMADLYRFQISEIEAARLKPGEEESLEAERRRLANAERLFQAVSDAFGLLYASDRGLAAVGLAADKLEDAARFDPQALGPLVEQIRSAYYHLEEVALQLRDYRDRIEFNPERLERVERRLDTLHALRRKYGTTVENILDYYEDIKSKLNKIEHHDEELERLRKETESTSRDLEEAADKLSALRREAARRLERDVERELGDLQMEGTRFCVRVESQESGEPFGPTGRDSVEFLISANPGEPPKPLARIASGGELSRVMLALKTVFARCDRVPVLVFDEIDTGVSGRAAQAIAEKMASLARDRQVFAVTHLPQVACMADAQYAVRKRTDGSRTFTEVEELDETGRVRELARMLGGVEITETTASHAREMLALAERKKTAIIKALGRG